MKTKAVATIAFSLGVLATVVFFSFQPQPVAYDSVRPVFSPDALGDVQAAVGSAHSTLDVELYQFSSPDMLQALAAAVARGVKVRIILEPRVDSNLQTATELSAVGVQVRWASLSFTNTHSKFAVADGRRVLVGSINWSRQALKTNREAAVVVDSVELAKDFSAVFEQDWESATSPAVAG